MTRFLGTVYDGFGHIQGSGLELAADGSLQSILTSNDLANTQEAGAHAADNSSIDGAYIVPGFVDVHCHGGGGYSFADDVDPAKIETAIRTHQTRGTTVQLASLVSLIDPMPFIQALVPFCEQGDLAGIHMEGPYVSLEKKGAQNPAAIRDIDLKELETWLEAGKGWIKTITIAPERANSDIAAQMLLDHGGKPSWGHTSADGPQTKARIDSTIAAARARGSQDVPQTVTHLFNAMFDIAHRSPGPVREFLQAARRGEISVEMIADGHHIAPELVEDATAYIDHAPGFGEASAGIFVTDALSAAGMAPGHYTLGGLAVEVRDGACYLEGTNTLAGGASTLSDQFQLMASRGNLTLAQVIRACVSGPAHAISLQQESTPGLTLRYQRGDKPNFVVLDADFRIRKVVREGEVIA